MVAISTRLHRTLLTCLLCIAELQMARQSPLHAAGFRHSHGGARRRAVAFLREMLAHWDAHAFGYWIAHDRESGAFAGRAGLRLMVASEIVRTLVALFG